MTEKPRPIADESAHYLNRALGQIAAPKPGTAMHFLAWALEKREAEAQRLAREVEEAEAQARTDLAGEEADPAEHRFRIECERGARLFDEY